MSQFQDNNRASLDTRQKTLTNYFCSGNSTAHSTTSEIHDDKVMVDSEYDGIFFSNDIFNSHIPYDDSNEPRETSMNSAEACTNQKKESSEKVLRWYYLFSIHMIFNLKMMHSISQSFIVHI